MTETTARPRITRPGSSVVINPAQVMRLRKIRDLTREEMSEAIRALGWTYRSGRPLSARPDYIGKVETGARHPSLEVLRAFCRVLGCTVADLMPGAPEFDMPEAEKARQARLEHNRELIAFARAHGLKYKGKRTYYGKPLEDAFARWVDLRIAEAAEDEAAVVQARKAFEAAVAEAPQDESVTVRPGKLARAS